MQGRFPAGLVNKPFDLRTLNYYYAAMVFFPCRKSMALIALTLAAGAQMRGAETFRVATYNVENYLDVASGSRPAKSELAKSKVRERILVITTKSGNLNNTQGK